MKKVVLLLITASLLIFAAGCGKDKEQGTIKTSDGTKSEKGDYKKIVPASNGLGFTWFSEAQPNDEGNIFISPISLFMALSMVFNGSDGGTKEEIARVLQVDGMEAAELNQANASLMNLLHKQSSQVQLNVANSIWLNKNYHFQTDFSKNNKNYFSAKIQEIDILDPQSPKTINRWVKDQTNGKIEEIVESPLDSDLVAILINAIYFKGNWQYEFDPNLTEERPFYLQNGTSKDIPFMSLHEKLAYMENEIFQAVSLPYGKNNHEMSMEIFLPRENIGLEELKKLLTQENWRKWNSQFNEKEGSVLLPKFQLEYEASLKETLKKLGMNTAFEKGANFSKMIQEDDPIWISQVKQKTFLDINEKGTEAAAATSAEMVTESFNTDGPFHMEINRPFVITITENKSQTILFIGAIANP